MARNPGLSVSDAIEILQVQIVCMTLHDTISGTLEKKTCPENKSQQRCEIEIQLQLSRIKLIPDAQNDSITFPNITKFVHWTGLDTTGYSEELGGGVRSIALLHYMAYNLFISTFII